MSAIAPRRMSFAELLRDERERQGLSHRDVARRCQVSKDDVRAWERGERMPERLEAIRLFGSFRQLRHYAHLVTPNDPVDLNAFGDHGPAKQLPAPVAPPEPSVPPTFGEALRRLRLREGLDQHEVGELLGVTGQAVSAWETDTNAPIEDHYTRLLDLLPDLRAAPSPDSRDIDKPGGGAGMSKLRTLRSVRTGAAPFMTVPGPDEIVMSDPPSTVDLTSADEAPPGAPAPAPFEEEEPMMMPNTPEPEAPALDKAALLRWGRAVHAVLSSPSGPHVLVLLEAASQAGMTVEEVLAALRE